MKQSKLYAFSIIAIFLGILIGVYTWGNSHELSHINRYSIFWNAALSGDMSTVKKMVERYPDLAQRDPDTGFCAIFEMINRYDPEMVSFFLEHGTPPNVFNGDSKETPLHSCASHLTGVPHDDLACERIASLLVAHGANVNSQDEFGSTPLHRLADKSNISVMQILLDRGADPKITNNWGKTVLDKAREKNNHAVIDLLKFTPFQNKK